MKKEIILHIGYPKTGTTTLQNHFFPKINEFKYLGKVYKANEPYTFDKELIYNILINIDADFYSKPREISSFFYNHIENRALLSEESILYNSIRPNKYMSKTNVIPTSTVYYAKVLRNIFSEEKFDVKILVSIRRQDEMVLSLYAQSFTHFYSKYKETNTFNKFLSFFLEEEMNSFNRVIDYQKVIKEYSELFGKEAIRILIFEELQQAPSEYYSKLCDYLKIDKSKYTDVTRNRIENSRNIGGKFKRTRNLTLLDLVKDSIFTKVKINSATKQRIKVFLKQIYIPSKKSDLSIYLTDAQRSLILKNYEKSNTEIALMYDLNLSDFGYFQPDIN